VCSVLLRQSRKVYMKSNYRIWDLLQWSSHTWSSQWYSSRHYNGRLTRRYVSPPCSPHRYWPRPQITTIAASLVVMSVRRLLHTATDRDHKSLQWPPSHSSLCQSAVFSTQLLTETTNHYNGRLTRRYLSQPCSPHSYWPRPHVTTMAASLVNVNHIYTGIVDTIHSVHSVQLQWPLKLKQKTN